MLFISYCQYYKLFISTNCVILKYFKKEKDFIFFLINMLNQIYFKEFYLSLFI